MFDILISAGELAQCLREPDWRLIDCRFRLDDPEGGRRLYMQGHLPGALYAHLDEDLSGPVIPGQTGRHPLPGTEALAATFSRWGIASRYTQVIAYDDMGGAFAARLWWLLRWLGHDKVAVLDGGIQAWLDAGGATRTGTEVAPAQPFHPRPRPEMLVDAGFVDTVRREQAYNLLDARAPERFRGEHELIDPVAGHIPGARNAFHAGNLDENGRFRAPEELRWRYEPLLAGNSPSHTICYCGSGVTACHNLLALEYAGFTGAKLYPGSWSEWVTDPEREVAKA
jgi:thiosulfate/3-mercaptopyruvate sulfurtransferase